MITWPDLEAALQGRPGWRRVGRTWRGALVLLAVWFAGGVD